MKLYFSSLVCHRDVEIFKFNWFCSRIHLDKGFDIKHVVLHDGTLTEEDKAEIRALPNVLLRDKPITLHDVPKAPLLGKLQTHEYGYEQGADQVILFDCDIFFYRNWDPDLRKMLQCRTTVMRDWGSSLGPHVDQYRALFGVHEDITTPNCNTGIISIRKEDYHLVEEKIQMHLENPFMIMEDQGIVFAAFYGDLSYVDGIKCVINNAEFNIHLWNWVKNQRGCHLMGMRTRHFALDDIVDHCISHLPDTIKPDQISPVVKNISWGLLEFDTYHFEVPLQKVPSTCDGTVITDAMYMHGGSYVKWNLPSRLSRFTAVYKCMDTGIKQNAGPAIINGKMFLPGEDINVPCYGSLEIITQHGPGTHLVFISPRLHVDKSRPSLDTLKAAANDWP